jgi:hypothetical protein
MDLLYFFSLPKNNCKIKKLFNFKKATLRLPLVDYAVLRQTMEFKRLGLMSMKVPEP